jgi:hypothetical protein
VLALFVLGWGGELAHVAFEAHAYCPEHQRLEHAHPLADAHAHVVEPYADSRAGLAFDAQSSAPDAHAACGLLLGRGDDPIAVRCATARAFLVCEVHRAPASIGHDTAALGALDVVSFAPKQSPPAV